MAAVAKDEVVEARLGLVDTHRALSLSEMLEGMGEEGRQIDDSLHAAIKMLGRLESTIVKPTLSPVESAEQCRIIREGSGKNAVEFAKSKPGADIKALEWVVLDYGSALDACFFARDIPGADIQALQKVVMERGYFEALILFARDVPGADRAALRSRLTELEAAGSDDGRFLDIFDTAFPEVAGAETDDALIPAGQSAVIQPK